MEIKMNTNISNEFKEITITINAPSLTEDTEKVISYISKLNTMPNQILANQDNKIYFIDTEDIICFFSRNKSNYVRTEKGTYKISYKLYELEEIFNKQDFIRISKSCIININQVECFDISVLGTIIVKLKDNSQENVSTRNVSQVMKILNERRKLK